MGQRHMLDDGKAQTDTFLGMPILVAATVEPFENTALLLLCNAATTVKHAEQHFGAVLVRLDGYGYALAVR